MNKYELRKLKKTVKQLKKNNESIYLKLNDCIYKCKNESGQLVEVDEIPSNATVEVVNCKKKDFFYWFCFNNKPYYVILS